MPLCSRATPEIAEIKAGHFCACHRYNDGERQRRAEEAMAAAQAEEKHGQAQEAV
jgi:hypothetical protein